jgi:hypothetical protein
LEPDFEEKKLNRQILKTLEEPCFLFYFCGLFNTCATSSDYIGLNDGMTTDYCTGKGVKETGLIEVLPSHFSRGAEETHKKPQPKCQ